MDLKDLLDSAAAKVLQDIERSMFYGHPSHTENLIFLLCKLGVTKNNPWEKQADFSGIARQIYASNYSSKKSNR